MSALALAVPVGAVFVFVACVSGLLVPLATSALARLETRSPFRSATASAAVLLGPWALAALAAVALVSPQPFAGCHCTEHGLHHPHLCLVHPDFAGPLLGPSALVLAAWGLAVAPRVIRLARECLASAAWARAVRRIATSTVDGVSVRVAPCGAATALTVGALSPVIVVDPRLWYALDGDARRAVIHHEAGHRLRGDGLTLLVLRWASALLPFSGGRQTLRNWQSATEVECDAHAAAEVGDPGVVAEALLAAFRARSASPEGASPAHALAAVAREGLEGRVLALVERSDRSRAARLGNDVLAVVLVALGAGALTAVLPGDVLHHAIETLIGVMVR
jgi:Zn-dependent protease with chaperone function